MIVEERMRTYINSLDMGNTPFLEELEKVYQQGYALDNEEELSGVICVGAPVLNYTGYPCGSIWISGPKDRLTEEQLRSTVQIVKEIAGQISAELGYRRV